MVKIKKFIIFNIKTFNNDFISKILLSSLYLFDFTLEKLQNFKQLLDSVVETPLHMPFGYNLISSVGLTRGGD